MGDWKLTKGILDLATGSFAYIQVRMGRCMVRILFIKIETTRTEVGVGVDYAFRFKLPVRGGQDLGNQANPQDGSAPELRAQEIAEEAHKSTQMALDYQAMLLSLSEKGKAYVCRGKKRNTHLLPNLAQPYLYRYLNALLLLLLLPLMVIAGPTETCAGYLRRIDSFMTQGVDAVVGAANHASSDSSMRKFKTKVDTLRQAFEPQAEKIVKTAVDESQQLTRYDKKDLARVEKEADELYSWAGSHVYKKHENHVGLDKAGKLMQMPYLVAMAYAIRVKMDVCYAESREVKLAERRQYQDRNRSIIEDITALLQIALNAILEKASLLEVALDYHWAVSTYVTLMVALRESEQMMLTPRNSSRTVELWDDGLSGIR